ncbi:MAG: D-2-hydroxyacid dehydrogenase family protein [Arthrobacter sp.]|jgi:phosphoglycerate dehydrogenase-like enzyme|nr:D-2-hydroxyacid dehydrogenase family protein [Arthrobacter sp.]
MPDDAAPPLPIASPHAAAPTGGRAVARLAILDDFQDAALSSADFAPLRARGIELTVFTHSLGQDPADIAADLAPFDAVIAMRERTPFSAEALALLPRLRLIVNTGRGVPHLDLDAAREHGVAVYTTGGSAAGAPELTWALLLAALRHLPTELANGREGRWQTTVGREAEGLTLGIVGLGRIGSRLARYGRAFGMNVLAWSPRLDARRAADGGAKFVPSLLELAERSDVLSVNLKLVPETEGLVNAEVLGALGPQGLLVNTARGPLVDEEALVEALNSGALGAAALDVYDTEPLPADHPLRSARHALLTPHIGFVTEQSLAAFYGESVQRVLAYLDGSDEQRIA